MDAKKRETPAISDRGFTFGLHFGTTHRMPGKPGQHTTVTAPQTASAQPLACGSGQAAAIHLQSVYKIVLAGC